MKKKLYRNTEEALVAGVLAGMADYFEHEIVFWRLGFVAFLIVTGLMPGLILYLVAWVIIPQRPRGAVDEPITDVHYTVHE